MHFTKCNNVLNLCTLLYIHSRSKYIIGKNKELYRNGSTIILCYVPHEICWGISVVQLVGLITEKNRAIVADCASTAGLADSAQIWAGY